MAFLPISRNEMEALGWEQPDFIYVTGDAYVDHPSFGAAIITRVLEEQGFKVCILAQPDWRRLDDFKRFGRPKYGFLVSSGNIDSMVAHYTAAKKRRNEDFYSPGKVAGKRPDRAVIVYCNCIRRAYGDIGIIIGGLEASLRRFAHYDYWDDKVRRSILIDSGADILSYGMGEKQTRLLAKALAEGKKMRDIKNIRGTCYIEKNPENLPQDYVKCPDFDGVKDDKKKYAKACRIQYDEQDHVYGRGIIQRHWDVYLVQNPPMEPLNTQELDEVFALPFERDYHPVYKKYGGVPAIDEVKFSIMHNRGCFGACNFCSIAFHQGRYVTSRSIPSLVKEAEKIAADKDFKGYIHDVGGPSANFRKPSCDKASKNGVCRGKKCLAPLPCPNLQVEHTEYLDILRKMRKIKGVKKVFVRSGIRFDYLILDKDDSFFKELIAFHTSGQLKVAPEHCSAAVLDKMGKPHIESYIRFTKKFYSLTKAAGKEQYLVPYLMSSHPGSRLQDAISLAEFLKKNRIRPEQVQDFYPTPGTISTCMFYTGLDPYTMKEVYVPRSYEDKREQRALLQYFRPENRLIVEKALLKAGRRDLIGSGPNCLIPPSRKPAGKEVQQKNGRTKNFAGKARSKGTGVKKNKKTGR